MLGFRAFQLSTITLHGSIFLPYLCSKGRHIQFLMSHLPFLMLVAALCLGGAWRVQGRGFLRRVNDPAVLSGIRFTLRGILLKICL